MPERWIDPGVPALRAELCQVKSTREEMVLLFGTHERLERCIILRPAVAKQLAAGLAAFMREHDAQLNATPAGRIESVVGDDDVPAGARPMLALVRGLGAGFGLEKSFKLSARSLVEERVILGVRTRLVERGALLDACRALGMPPPFVEQFDANLAEANTVGFGFEEGGLYKVYLEFWESLRLRLQHDPRNADPALLFLGFKWRSRGEPKAALARYTCYPLLSVEDIARRLQALSAGPSAAAALEILELAARRIGEDSFVYVEAAEEGNPRKSFDLNLYKAGLRVSDLQEPLCALARGYAIDASAAQRAFALERAFGHLSGGLGRDGRDFLSVYYEIEGL